MRLLPRLKLTVRGLMLFVVCTALSIWAVKAKRRSNDLWVRAERYRYMAKDNLWYSEVCQAWIEGKGTRNPFPKADLAKDRDYFRGMADRYGALYLACRRAARNPFLATPPEIDPYEKRWPRWLRWPSSDIPIPRPKG